MAMSKLISSISTSIRGFCCTSTAAHLLPVTRDHALIPVTVSLPTSTTAAPCPHPAATSDPMATLDLSAHCGPSLPRSPASVEMTSIVRAAPMPEENPDQFPSSSSIMDNLQLSSSLDSFSSTEAGRSHPDDNNYHLTENIRLIGEGTRNHLPAREIGIITTASLVAGNPVNNIAGVDTSGSGNVSNENEKKKKGLLGSIHVMTERLHTCVIAIFAVCGGFFATIVQGGKKHTVIALILFSGNTLAMLVSSFVLSPLSFYMRESESIEVVQDGIIIWVLIALLVYYYDEFIIALRLVASIPASLAWTLGSIGAFLILLGGVWFMYTIWAKMVKDVMLDGGN